MSEIPVEAEEPRAAGYIAELSARIEARPKEPVTGADLLQALLPVAQALEEIGRHRDTLAETVQFVNVLQERLLIVDELPAEAPMGALLRLRNGTLAQRAALYLGNGAGQPLSKLVPVPV